MERAQGEMLHSEPTRSCFHTYTATLKHLEGGEDKNCAVLLEIVLDDIEEIEDLEAVVFGQLVCDSGGGVGDEEEMSFCVSICTFVPACASEFVLLC